MSSKHLNSLPAGVLGWTPWVCPVKANAMNQRFRYDDKCLVFREDGLCIYRQIKCIGGGIMISRVGVVYLEDEFVVFQESDITADLITAKRQVLAQPGGKTLTIRQLQEKLKEHAQ